MFNRPIFLLGFLFFSFIDGSHKFRFDYSYNRGADGWLKLHIVPATWSDARLICHAEGAVLASPLTQELHSAILDEVSIRTLNMKKRINTIFTGVHTTFSKGVYASVEGVPLSKLPISWATQEPDNYENSESCLAMMTAWNGTMMDAKCTNVFPFVCYKKKTHNLVITRCGTHDTGYNFDARTGSCYKFHRHGMTWPKAYMTCMAEGGYLTIINSDVEAQVLKDVYARNPEDTIFAKFPYAAIGIYDSNDGGYWMTIHGETPAEAGYNKWQPGEPNNGTQPKGEFCGVTHRNNGFLHDAPCDWVVPFICEKTPESLEDSESSEVY